MRVVWLIFLVTFVGCQSPTSKATAAASASPTLPSSSPTPAPTPTGFVPPNADERLRALGELGELPEQLQRVFTPSASFEPISEPEFGDWLESQVEHGQSYNRYLLTRPNLPDNRRDTIFYLPLGDFGTQAPDLKVLEEFGELFFGLSVKVLEPVSLSELKLQTRVNKISGTRQLLTDDILAVSRERLPENGYCMLAITMSDLYPGDDWNYVFGMATLKERVGVYSFARYDPSFYNEARDSNWKQKLLERSFKVLAHETGHMFGLAHCIYFDCLMNGSNNLPETDRQPPTLCPICLRKLHHAVGFEPVERYRKLETFYNKVGLSSAAGRISRRLEELE